MGVFSSLASPRPLILATNSVPARAPALRFWVWLFREERLSAPGSSQISSLVKSTAGTGLTIRSSRARFAASCKFLQVSLAQGRKAARLNSGVRPVQKQMPVNKRQSNLSGSCTVVPRALSLATNSVPARAAGTPFLGLASRKERLPALDSGQIGSLFKSTAGTGLTTRSSRARFAASCKYH